MNMLDEGFTMLFPKDFFCSYVNEKIQTKILLSYFNEKEYKTGDAKKKEPDVFIGDRPIELTLACNKSKTNNFIKGLKSGTYSSQNVDEDIKKYIISSIERKKKKRYSTKLCNTIISIFLTIPNYDWVLGNYGSVFSIIFLSQRDSFFNSIYLKYVKSHIFKDVVIIYPGLAYDWYVSSVTKKDCWRYGVKDRDILSREFPYAIFNNFSGLK